MSKGKREAASLERTVREDLTEQVTLELRPAEENRPGKSIPDRRRSQSKVRTRMVSSRKRMASMAGPLERGRWSQKRPERATGTTPVQGCQAEQGDWVLFKKPWESTARV